MKEFHGNGIDGKFSKYYACLTLTYVFILVAMIWYAIFIDVYNAA